MFIKPARCCCWQHLATYVAVAAERAEAGPMSTLCAFLAADNARPLCRMVRASGCRDRPIREEDRQEALMMEQPWAVLCMLTSTLPAVGHTSAVPLPQWGLWAMTLLAQCGESQPCHKWRAATLPQEIRQVTQILQCWSLCDLSRLYLVLCSEFTLLRHDKITQVTSHKHKDKRCVWQSHARQIKSTTSR